MVRSSWAANSPPRPVLSHDFDDRKTSTGLRGPSALSQDRQALGVGPIMQNRPHQIKIGGGNRVEEAASLDCQPIAKCDVLGD